jgi:ABC-2 type transport system permease protein
MKLKKYVMSLSMGFANSMEYRFDFVVSLVSTIFPIIIQIFLWTAIYRSSGNAVLYGYSFPQMIMYTMLAGAVSMFIRTGVEHEINDDIHSGKLANMLIKPISYIPFRITHAIGEKITSIIVMIVFSVVVTITLHFIIGFDIAVINLVLFVPAIIMAFVLNFFIFFCVSTSAFWITEANRFFYAINIIIMVASGGVFPIDIFGEVYVKVLNFLPIIYTTTFPIKIANGAYTVNQITNGLLVQAGWIVAFSILAKLLWTRGCRKFVAVGG